MRRHPAVVLVLAGLACTGCNQPFQPDGAFDGRLAVYGILSASSDTQFVRISRTYNGTPSGDVTDASVDVVPSNGDPGVHFRDTTVIHSDASGRSASYFVYVAYNFRPKSHVAYRLEATSPSGGNVVANTIGLGQDDETLMNPASLTTGTDSVVLQSSFGSTSGAFVVHLYVEYEVTTNGVTTTGREEVPAGIAADASGNPVNTYPVFARVPTAAPSNSSASAVVWFSAYSYQRTRADILGAYPARAVRLTGVSYTLTQIDDALYDYYYVLNGPKDPATIRLDLPDYTNVAGGLGIVACTEMLVRRIPLP